MVSEKEKLIFKTWGVLTERISGVMVPHCSVISSPNKKIYYSYTSFRHCKENHLYNTFTEFGREK